jgi:hypothetical protein
MEEELHLINHYNDSVYNYYYLQHNAHITGSDAHITLRVLQILALVGFVKSYIAPCSLLISSYISYELIK